VARRRVHGCAHRSKFRSEVSVWIDSPGLRMASAALLVVNVLLLLVAGFASAGAQLCMRVPRTLTAFRPSRPH